jgi:hypothetical protein
MTMIEQNIDALLADPLGPARRARRAIGYVGLDIPEDLLAADGIFSCHLPWHTGRATPLADRYLEASFPGWARSMLEDWAAGCFDFLEFVVFTRGDDTAQRMYYYICELQRRGLLAGPEPLIFDIAKIQRPSSIDWTIRAVQRLATILGLDDQALQAGMRSANHRRSTFNDIQQARGTRGSLYERIARASLCGPAEDLVAGLVHPQTDVAGRVVLAGSSPPDERLHRAVEGSGWSVVSEACDRSLDRLGPPVTVPQVDPVQAIGKNAHAAQRGSRGFLNRAAALTATTVEARADAVIIWLIEQDEALAWDLAAQRQSLQAVGMPTLVLMRRQWDCSDGPADEIAQFLRGLGR